MFNDRELVREILQNTKTIAVVGLSPKSYRTSHEVSSYLQKNGYRIIPVNPNADKILGEKCYASLEEIPEPVDTVLVFRRSELVMPVAEAAIKIKPKYLWMQEGVINSKAAALAENNKIKVVMDICMFKEHVAARQGF